MSLLRWLLNPWADAREQRQQVNRLCDRVRCLEFELKIADRQHDSRVRLRDQTISVLTEQMRSLRAENESNRLILRALGDSMTWREHGD